MNYFFELLDSYHKRDCCVSRIDENVNKLQQDFAQVFPSIQAALSKSLKGTVVAIPNTTVSASVNNRGEYKLKFSANPVDSASITEKGLRGAGGKGLPDKKIKRFHTIYFGEQAPEDEEDTTDTDEEGLTQQPTAVNPEVLKKQVEYQSINTDVVSVLDQMSQDPEALCRAQIRFDKLIKDLRPSRDKFRGSQTKLAEITQDRNIALSIANNLTNKFKNYYKKQENSCQFINDMLNLFLEKHRDAIKNYYLNGSLEQARLNILGRNENSIANSIEFSSDPKIAQTLQKLLDGSCKPKEVCVPEEEVSEEDKIALRESFSRIMELAKKPKLSTDEKQELTGLLRLTDDRRIAIKGITSMDSIIIPDRGRSFLDMVKFIERKHKINFEVLPLLDKLKQEGSENQAIGTLFEHWKKITSLMLGQMRAEPKDKARFQKVIDSYISKVKDICQTMQTIDDRIKASGKGKGITLQSYEDLIEVKHNSVKCAQLKGINRLLTSRVMSSFTKIGVPDAVVQTGTITGKGFRPDVMLAYNDIDDATNAAIKSGLPSESVQTMTMGDLLKLNQSFKNELEEAGLTGKGQQYDLNKVVYVIPEGLKTSSGRGTNGVNTGTSYLNSITEDLNLAAAGGESPWVNNVASDLGITDSRRAASKISSKLEEAFQAIERSVDKALPSVSILGTKENTANLTATQIMNQIRTSSIDGPNTSKDEAFAIASDFARIAKTANPNPKFLDRYKTRLKEVLRRRVLESSLSEFFDSDNIEDREAGALLLGLVGGVNSTQSLHYVDLTSDKQYIGNHNSLAVAPIKALIEGTEGYTYSIKRAAHSFAVSITTPGKSNVSIRFSGTGKGSTFGTTSVSKSLFEELGFVNLNEEVNKSENSQIMTEMIKMLKSQLVHLRRIFG